MDMHFETEATYQDAKMGCYHCGSPNDGIVFGPVIEGEGRLRICTACLRDACKIANVGRARMERERRAAARREAASA